LKEFHSAYTAFLLCPRAGGTW